MTLRYPKDSWHFPIGFLTCSGATGAGTMEFKVQHMDSRGLQYHIVDLETDGKASGQDTTMNSSIGLKAPASDRRQYDSVPHSRP